MEWRIFYCHPSCKSCLSQTILPRLLIDSCPLHRPPGEIHDVVSVMDNIQEDFKNVRQQFRELLEVPYLHILQVDDPFRSQASAERIEQHTGVDQPKVGLIPVIRRFNKVRSPMPTYLQPC